jgi:type I restriction enzyme, S subunit
VSRLSAAETRYIENAVFIAASRLLFRRLDSSGTQTFKLGDIADTSSGGTPDRGNPSYFGGDIPWIKSGELNDGLINMVEETITLEGLNSSSARIFPAGTVVIGVYGATVGNTGIVAFDAESNQAVCGVTPNSPSVH